MNNIINIENHSVYIHIVPSGVGSSSILNSRWIYYMDLPKLEEGKYKVTFQRNNKGKFRLRRDAFDVIVSWNKRENFFICKNIFTRLFGKKAFGSIPTKSTLYDVKFRKVR